jgi:ABC-type lipoprotein release transport system permease subunit
MSLIERQRSIVDFALSSLGRRWRRNAALAVVYALIVFVLASAVFLTEALKQEARLALAGAPEIVVQRLTAGRHDLIPAAHIETLARIRGVGSVKGRIWGYYYDPATGANYTVLASGGGPEGPPQGAVALGQGVARALGAAAGDLIPFKDNGGAYVSFEVARIFSAQSELVSSDLIEMNDADARAFLGVPEGFYTDLALGVANARERVVVAEKIRRLIPDTRPILREEILRTYDAAFDWRGGLVLLIFAGAVAAFAILAWDKAAGLGLEERREIGVLKAIGWETSEVIALKSWEGIIVSFTAFAAGLLAAYVHVFAASAILFEPVMKGWAVLYPRFQLVPHVTFYQVAAIFFLTVVPYTVATIVPAWNAATVDPDAIMRL